jgi:hypothetical protein
VTYWPSLLPYSDAIAQAFHLFPFYLPPRLTKAQRKHRIHTTLILSAQIAKCYCRSPIIYSMCIRFFYNRCVILFDAAKRWIIIGV